MVLISFHQWDFQFTAGNTLPAWSKQWVSCSDGGTELLRQRTMRCGWTSKPAPLQYERNQKPIVRGCNEHSHFSLWSCGRWSFKNSPAQPPVSTCLYHHARFPIWLTACLCLPWGSLICVTVRFSLPHLDSLLLGGCNPAVLCYNLNSC